MSLPDRPVGKQAKGGDGTQLGVVRKVTVPGGGNRVSGTARDVTSSFVQSPAHSEAGGPGWNSEASREEPEMLESIPATVGGTK